MTKKILSILTSILLFISLCQTAAIAITIPLPQREIININQEWQYLEKNEDDVSKIDGLNGWEKIDLPHTWNQWDAVDNSPGYRRDASWYKKEMKIPSYDDAQYVLYFEGVNITSHVYVNGVDVGGHTGGYVGFEIDITDHVKKGEINIIKVKVDNSYKLHNKMPIDGRGIF